MNSVLAAEGKCVVNSTSLAPSPGSGEMLVKVHACGINRLDTMQRQGKVKPPPGASPVLGMEVAGEVVELGPDTAGFSLGDRVMALVTGGGYADLCVCPAATSMVIPEALSWVAAAGVCETFLTAFQLLHIVGQVTAGETVLLHAASSGVGTAAIQLCVAAGANVVVTVGSSEKLEACKKLGAIGGAVRHDGPWYDQLVAQGLLPAGGGGADLILDCVGKDYVGQNLNSLNLDARWVLYSLLSGGALSEADAVILMPRLMLKRASLLATTLRGRPLPYKANLVERFKCEALPAIANGKVKVVVDAVFENGLVDAQAAHDLMESNATTGKLILALSPEAQGEAKEHNSLKAVHIST